MTLVIAAPFGLIDWLAIPAGTRAKRIGAWHGGGNVIVLLMYAGSWWLRREAPQAPMMVAYMLSFGGGIIALCPCSRIASSNDQKLFGKIG